MAAQVRAGWATPRGGGRAAAHTAHPCVLGLLPPAGSAYHADGLRASAPAGAGAGGFRGHSARRRGRRRGLRGECPGCGDRRHRRCVSHPRFSFSASGFVPSRGARRGARPCPKDSSLGSPLHGSCVRKPLKASVCVCRRQGRRDPAGVARRGWTRRSRRGAAGGAYRDEKSRES